MTHHTLTHIWTQEYTNHIKCIKVFWVEMLQWCQNSHPKTSDSINYSCICVCSSWILLKQKIQLVIIYENAKNKIKGMEVPNSNNQSSWTWKITLIPKCFNSGCSKSDQNINSIKACWWIVEVVRQNKKLKMKKKLNQKIWTI